MKRRRIDEAAFGAGLLGLLATSAVLSAAADVPAGSETPAEAPDELPERVVSSNLSTDEILLSLLPPERLVAVGMFADDPRVSNVTEAARRVPHRVRGDAEELLALEPDVVFAATFGRAEVQAMLARARVPVLRPQAAESLDDVAANVRWVGEHTGRRDEAEALVDRMHETLRSVAERVAGADRPTVLLYEQGGYSAGRGTLLDEVITAAGARNVVADAGLDGHVALPVEKILQLDPDVVVVADYRADGRSRALFETGFAEEPVFSHLRAVREGRVVEVRPAVVFSSSHFVANGVEELARALHPGRFEAAP